MGIIKRMMKFFKHKNQPLHTAPELQHYDPLPTQPVALDQQ